MLASPGIGSGLDVNGIVSQLMDRLSVSLCLAILDGKEARHQAQLSGFGNLKGCAIFTFQDSISAPCRSGKI